MKRNLWHRTRTVVNIALLMTIVGAQSQCAWATLPTDGLEGFDYQEMTLLKALPGHGRAAAACFYASHDYANGGIYVWVHPMEAVGNRNGALGEVFKDRVRIDAVQAVNGKDWVEIKFVWPVASGKDSKVLARGCGSGPNR